MSLISAIANPATSLIPLAIMFGVFVHDARIEKAIIATVAVDNFEHIQSFSTTQHTHSDSGSLSGASSLGYQQPTVQPRNHDEKKYLAFKRLTHSGFDNDYSWMPT